jgi:hypothetical protein
MRKSLLIVTLLASSACGTSGQWQKAGTDQAVVDNDLRQCRHDALQESLRLYADWRPFAFDSPPYWNYRDLQTRRLVSRINDNNQTQAEQMLAVACMRNKGYATAGA